MNDGLKQRLVGAIVLVAIAVLFLPSLFSRDAQRTVDLTSQIPPQPAEVAELLEVPEPRRPDNIPPAKALEENYPHEAAAPSITPPDAARAGPAAANDAATSVAAASPKAEEAPDSKQPVLNEQGVPDAWSLQVASFTSADRAEAMEKRLREAGYKSYVRKAQSGETTVHRVFVGPKIDRQALEAEKRQIDKRFGINSLVVEFKP